MLKIILEGTEDANTREISHRLSQRSRLADETGYSRFTSVISTMWGNFDDFPWGKDLVDFKPTDEDKAMKNYRVWVRLIELQGNYNWIIDRFHITTQQYQLQYHNHGCDFTWLEKRLLAIGFHLILVTKSTKIDQIIHTQDLLRKISSKSILPRLELDITQMTVQDTVDDIINWYKSNKPGDQSDDNRPKKIYLPSCS